MRFDRNNLRKLALSPLLLLGWFVARVVPRTPTLCVVGSGIGFGEGGVPLGLRAQRAGIRVVWLSDTFSGRAAAAASGFETERVHSWRGWWLTIRAQTLIVSHGLGDVNPYAQSGATIVQLWHGVPLKHLHRDAGVTYSLPNMPGKRLAERLLRWGSERAYSRISYVVAASTESARRLASAFGLRPDQLLISGDPRDDALCIGGATERRAAARTLIEEAAGVSLARAVVLFAPTWRDGQVDPVVPTVDEWDEIERFAADTECTVIIRPHPLAIGEYRSGSTGRTGVLLLDVSVVADITPALPACDVLITDYSSIAYDFALLKRPMVFFAPDLEGYAATRGFYEPIGMFYGGEPHRTWLDTLEAVRRVNEPEHHAAAVAHAEAMSARVHDFQDGHNSDRVFSAVFGG